jgi:tetratricopeptide (TPR) repeat protein
LVAERRDETLELGMADTLINKLSSIREIIVRPISAVRKYSALNQDPLAAGRELGVDAVLDASIQWDSENKIRVAARLLRVRDGSTIWTDKCDEQCSNVFELQDSIAERVARALSPRLTGGQRGLLAKHYTESVEAYQLYLQGLYFWNMMTKQGTEKAIEYFQQAIAKDSNYALAYAGLAHCYVLRSAEEGAREVLPKAREAATKAIEIDNNLSEAHSTLGAVKGRLELDWPGAESEQKLAIALNPNNAIAHFRYGMGLAHAGRFNDAEAEIQKSLEIDPFSIMTRNAVPLIFYWSRRNDEAIAEYQKVMEMAPAFPLAQRELGLAYEQKGMYQEALEQLQKSLALPGNYFKTMNTADIGHLYAVWGKTAEARKVLEELIHKSKQGYALAYELAVIYAGLGEKDKALESLNKAYEDRSFWMVWVKGDPRLDGLRSDPRFTDLLRRMKIY